MISDWWPTSELDSAPEYEGLFSQCQDDPSDSIVWMSASEPVSMRPNGAYETPDDSELFGRQAADF